MGSKPATKKHIEPEKPELVTESEEPELEVPKPKRTYFCTKCGHRHVRDSAIGILHSKYAEHS